MNIKNEYKNAVQTKMKIASSYLALSIENKKFSVIDVVKMAEINRGTFYLHFKNLNEVEKYIDDELAERFKTIEMSFRLVDISKEPEIVLNKLNEILLADLSYFKLVLQANKNSNLFIRIKTSILNSISNNFQIMKYVTDFERFKIFVQFIVGGVLTAYADWLNGEINCEIDKLSTNLSRVIKDAVRGYIVNGFNFN